MNKPNQAKQLPLTGFPRRSHWRWSILITVITLQYFIPENRLKHRIQSSYSICFVLFQISKCVQPLHRHVKNRKAPHMFFDKPSLRYQPCFVPQCLKCDARLLVYFSWTHTNTYFLYCYGHCCLEPFVVIKQFNISPTPDSQGVTHQDRRLHLWWTDSDDHLLSRITDEILLIAHGLK